MQVRLAAGLLIAITTLGAHAQGDPAASTGTAE